MFLIGSFGASAVLIYGVPMGELSQPRNLVGGHVISALVGVIAYNLFSFNIPLAAAMAVSCAIAGMLATNTTHPPGGATALIAVIGGDSVHKLGADVCLFSRSDRGADHAVDCGDREQFLEKQGPALSEILDLKSIGDRGLF